MAVVNELVTKFTFKGSLKPLGDFQVGLQDSIKTIGKYGAAMIAVTAATATWANSTLRGAESLIRLSEDSGIAIEQLQKMKLITAQNGVSNEVFEQSISSLTQRIGDAATQGNDDFNRLGISVRDANGNIKSTDTVLLELSKRFKSLSGSQQQSFAQRLGIDNNVIGAFQKTDKELKKLSDRALKFGVITTKQTKQLNQYYASMETLKFGFTAVSRQVALKLAPSMEAFSIKITNFLADFGTKFATVFSEFVDGIGNIFSAINYLVTATVGWKPVLIAFGAIFAIAFPITFIVAGIAAILIAVEDLITAFKGGKSVIADFFKDTFDIDIVAVLTTAFEKLKIGLKVLKDGFTIAFNAIGIAIDFVYDRFKKLIDFWKGAADTVSNIFNKFKSFFGSNDTNINVNTPNVNNNPSPLQPLQSPNNTNTTTQQMNNDIKIEVKSNDPQAAGQAVASALNDHLAKADFQFNKGGR